MRECSCVVGEEPIAADAMKTKMLDRYPQHSDEHRDVWSACRKLKDDGGGNGEAGTSSTRGTSGSTRIDKKSSVQHTDKRTMQSDGRVRKKTKVQCW